MYARLVVNVAVAFLLRGTHAKCKTQQEIEALTNASFAKLSQSCRMTVGVNTGSAPNCNQGSAACMMKMSMSYTMTCSGSMCSTLSEALKPRTVVSEPQTCYPDVCRSSADAITFLNVSMMRSEDAACSASSSGTSSSATSGANISVSSIDVDGIQLVCGGQVVGSIGTIKQATPMPSTEPSPMPTALPTPMPTAMPTSTCSDVKQSYKAQGCCGSPMKPFVMSGGSSTMPANKGRLLGDRKEALLDSLKEVLEQARAEGTHIQVAKEIIDMMKEHA